MEIILACPICRKVEVIQVENAPIGEIKSVALNHQDHVVLVEYDYTGMIRSVYTVRVSELHSGKTIKCPECGKEISLPDTDFDEIAFIHDDHVAIVYAIGNKYMVDTVKVVKEVTERVPENVIKKACDIIGIDNLAYLISKILFEDVKVVHIPSDAVEILSQLFGKIDHLRHVAVIPGELSKDKTINITLFKKILSEAINKPEREAIRMLDHTISALIKFSEMLVNLLKQNEIEQARNFLNAFPDAEMKQALIFLAKKKAPPSLVNMLLNK